MITSLPFRALAFASTAHASINHRRKYSQEPYIVHPIRVAQIVASVGGSDHQIAAALLHDVVEDTPVTIEEIEAEFGLVVAEMVGWLTDVSKPEDGNRKVRKAMDRDHAALSPPDVKTIKLADIIDNCESIVTHDPGFARVYLRERRELLAVLQEGHPELLERANGVVEGFLRR